MTQNNIYITVLCNLSLFDTGCNNASVYGSKCDKPCPPNCKDNTCNIQNGSCFLCKAGWSGLDCDMSMNTSIVFSYLNVTFL